MTASEANLHVLDAGYKPFPPFSEWLKRTALDTVRWDRYNESLQNAPGMSTDRLRWAANVATRAAALDTGAIENLYEVDRGFTYTVAFETSAWEVALAQKGESVRPLFEAQLQAYDYVLSLATTAEPITEAAIRVLQEVVCQAQPTYRVMTAIGPQEQPLPKGRYKSLPNHVRTRDGVDHSYAPVDVTPAEMARLVSEMRTEAFLAAHPVQQAAYAHYALVVIHPFADGNGRVARALASAFTYRAISMPIVILSEQKDIYLDALEAADRGEFQAFLDFMLARALDTIQLVDESVLNANYPSAVESLASIDGLFRTKEGYSQSEIDEGGFALLESAYAEAERVLKKIANQNLTYDLEIRNEGRPPAKESHRNPVGGPRRLQIRIKTGKPLSATVIRTYHLFLPKDALSGDDITLERTDSTQSFNARVDAVLPAPSGVLKIRIAIFAERVVGEMLAELKTEAQRAQTSL